LSGIPKLPLANPNALNWPNLSKNNIPRNWKMMENGTEHRLLDVRNPSDLWEVISALGIDPWPTHWPRIVGPVINSGSSRLILLVLLNIRRGPVNHPASRFRASFLSNSIATVNPAKPPPKMSTRFDAVFCMKHFSRPSVSIEFVRIFSSILTRFGIGTAK